MDNIEKRLACAQLLNGLLKKSAILNLKNPKIDKEIASEVDGFVRKQLQNLLFKVMGEQNENDFNSEEIQILKAMTTKIKTMNGEQK